MFGFDFMTSPQDTNRRRWQIERAYAPLKVLCTCLPEYGHFNPMVSIARALVEAGGDVAFATAEEFCPRVERAGFAAFPAGMSLSQQLAEARRRFPEEGRLPPGQQRFVSFVPKMLAGVAAPARVADLMPIVEGWHPDLLVHGEAELAGPVAATLADVPFAGHSVGVLRPLEMARQAGQTLAPLCEQWGIDPGPLAGMFRYLYLDVCPPALQAHHISEISVAHSLRPLSLDAVADEDLPPWLVTLGSAPIVYVTLGTIFNQDPDLFLVILEGLREEPVDVIVTVGYGNDPASLGPQPDNVHIERYIPQSLLLPHCDVVITQGGWSMIPMLGHGLPLLLVPQGAIQFYHSEAGVACGAARRLLPGEVSPDAIAREVRVLIEDPAYGETAERIRTEIERMPGPEHSVRLLEQLARERRPLIRGDVQLD